MSADADDPANDIMCECSGTTRGKIYDLHMQGMSIDEISNWTGAKTGCGGCEWEIEAFIKALAEVQAP